MNLPSERPDPDALLRRALAEEARAKRGKLKIFFGFAPGVGKTYRMLKVARDLVDTQRLDVVVGVVETHRRQDTAAMLEGLELLPRRGVEHRGRTLDEFDLDAALARRPSMILVDELAHTNAPGSRHPKRWNDVEELLDAGIDVLTTMNVQHIESLNDVIAQITRVTVHETVPDSVLDRADAIELVDIAPEELLQRLKEGKVYLPDQAQRAAEHFFRRGNLLALRELALRRTAQHVDEDVREYREEHGVSATWPASERILVCVGPAPSSDRLIRATARIAAGLRCPWIAAYVEAAALGGISDANRERLEAHLRVAESLGATVIRLSGVRVAETLLSYARRHNVTRLVIGKPTHAWLRDRLRGSLLDEVVRGSGDIDVHVISGEGGEERAVRPEARAQTPQAPLRDFLWAGGLSALTVAVAAILHSMLALPDIGMLFLLPIMASAGWFGRGPSLLSAVLSVAAYDFFFVPPYLTFAVSDSRHLLTFGMLFGVGFVISELAGRMRRQEQDARSREERTANLYALSRELVASGAASEVAAIAVRHAAESFAARVHLLGTDDAGALEEWASVPAEARLEPNDLGVARWALEHDELSGLGTHTLPGAQVLCMPLRVGEKRLGVLALFPTRGRPLGSDGRAFLEVVGRQVAAALERARLAEEARHSALRARTEEMRASLLSAVSHDLRTPLASITGAATTLRDGAGLTAETRSELVESIVGEAERLERLVTNLLDMTRLDAGGLKLHREWVPVEELVGSALARLEARLQGRSLQVRIPGDLPWLCVDPVLFEQVFVNVLENAVKYTPAGTPIEIDAHGDGDRVRIDLIDHGPGIPAGNEERVFEKFFRGHHPGASGAGLGLAICRGIVEAHGGTIRVTNRAEGGAVFQLSMPAGRAPAAAPAAVEQGP